MKQNSLASGIIIKLVFVVALVGLSVFFLYQYRIAVGASLGVYFIARCILKVIKLSIRIVFTIISILLLLVAIAILITIIF